MDGLIHAALEAEDILNRAKHVNSGLSRYESGVPERKMTWSHDKLHLPEPVDETRVKCQSNSGAMGMVKTTEKFDLIKKLHELHNELSRDESLQANYQGLKTTSYLLEKLLAIYNLNTLIINLYPGNKGYSLSLKINGNTQQLSPPEATASGSSETALIETPRWPYEEEELLSYIDNEEIPVVLLDLLETEHSCLFYSGCIIAQIRDYRQSYPMFLCDTHHVLLKPTNQSILTDAMCIGSRCGWANEERASLEAALVLATAPPLCLDPRPAVGLLSAKLHSASRLLNTPRIRRQAKKFSQVAVNRKRKLDQFTHYHGLELLELIHRQRAKNSRQSVPHTRLTSKYPKKPPEVFKPIEPPKMESIPLAIPSEPSAPLRLARAYERPRPSPDCQPQLVEEYVLETEKTSPHAGAGFFHIKLSILQRPSDQEFLGELYVDRDHVEGEKNGAACRFSLGTRLQANKYIQQFTEIFTEEGRKSVRIKHIVPGQLPRVSFTGGMRELGQQLLLQQHRSAAVAAAAAAAAASNPIAQASHTTPVPVGTTSITSTSNTHPTARSLPILQAQLQAGGVSSAGGSVAPVGSVANLSGTVGALSNIGPVGNIGPMGTLAPVGTMGPIGTIGPVGTIGPGNTIGAATGNVDVLKPQQPSPSTTRLSPQVHDLHSSQASTNQLLAQQLTNPPQPLNPQKMQSTIIHIQHPLMSSAGTSQVQNIQYTSVAPTQQKAPITKPRTTNPAISALVTSLMNSAQQFQQAASQKAAVSTPNSNAAILNLLNSAPAAMTHPTTTHGETIASTPIIDSGGHKTLLGRTVSLAGARLIATVTTTSQTQPTYTHQVLTGYRCDGDATNVSSSESALLERLITPATDASSQQTNTSQPQTMCQLQGLSLASLQGLQGIQGLQNVQVQIPGLSQPISLSLNVSGAPSGLLVSVPPTTSVVLTNQPSVLSLPIAQLMSSSGVKGVRGGVQLVRAPRPSHPSITSLQSNSTGTPQFITQTQPLNPQQVRRKSNQSDGS